MGHPHGAFGMLPPLTGPGVPRCCPGCDWCDEGPAQAGLCRRNYAVACFDEARTRAAWARIWLARLLGGIAAAGRPAADEAEESRAPAPDSTDLIDAEPLQLAAVTTLVAAPAAPPRPLAPISTSEANAA